MLIGAFWTRLGSPTGVEDSGTVEEVKLFLKQQKPVMLYYSKKPVVMDDADLEQVQKLKDFKKSIRDKGIQEEYNNIDELKQKLMRQLTIVMRGISVGTHVNAKVVKEAKATPLVDPALTNKPIEKNTDSIKLVEYTEKSLVVIGDTTKFKDNLLAINGKWIKLKGGGYGWMFSKKRLSEVAKILNIPPRMS